AVPGLLAWARPGRFEMTPAVLMALAPAALSIAHSMPHQGAAGVARLGLLVLASGPPPLLLRRHAAMRGARSRVIVAVLLAAVPVALAIGWQLRSGDAPAGLGQPPDDPYLTPR